MPEPVEVFTKFHNATSTPPQRLTVPPFRVVCEVCLGNHQRKLSIVARVSVVGLWSEEGGLPSLLMKEVVLCQQRFWHVNKPQPTEKSAISHGAAPCQLARPGAAESGAICNRKCLTNRTAFRAPNYTQRAKVPYNNLHTHPLGVNMEVYVYTHKALRVYESWCKVLEVNRGCL